MVPWVRTAEFSLLEKLVENSKYPALALNGSAVQKAVNEGYISWLGDYVYITPEGRERFEDLNNR